MGVRVDEVAPLGARELIGLLDTAPDAIVVVDRDGLIVMATAQVERLFGYARDELLGQTVEVLMPADRRAHHMASRVRYFAGPTSRPMGIGMHLSARRKDGTEFPAEISLSSLATADGLLVSAAVRDITDRVEGQDGRKHQSERLESLGQLAGGIAHDFNNLLTAILGYAEFVQEAVTVEVDATGDPRWRAVQVDVEHIFTVADRAVGLIRQLLAFGRRDVVRARALDLNSVVAGIEPMLRRTLGEHISLESNLAPRLRLVLADPGQMEQVLVNLVVNSRDAMPGGGVLTIDTANVDLDPDAAGWGDLQAGPHVRLRVSDTGTGMAPEVVHRLFEPFFTTKPKGEGTGLGLATVYGIVTQADGHVRFISAPGRGTTCTVLLPATETLLAADVRLPAPVLRTTGGETVLLVEDEAAVREVTSRFLRRNGYRVVQAASGSAAIEIARGTDRRIHLLLTDVIMPTMLGKEVADRLRAVRPDIRVLYMSGYAHPVLASQGTLEPGVVLVEKPFTEAVLLARVQEALAG